MLALRQGLGGGPGPMSWESPPFLRLRRVSVRGSRPLEGLETWASTLAWHEPDRGSLRVVCPAGSCWVIRGGEGLGRLGRAGTHTT